MNNLHLVLADVCWQGYGSSEETTRAVAAFEDIEAAEACVTLWNQNPLKDYDANYRIEDNIRFFPKDISLFAILNEMRG